MDLFTFAGIPITVGASEAVHRQRILDEEAEAEDRQDEFYLDVFCDAQSRKKDQVHDAIVVLKAGKIRLWPKDPKTKLPASNPGDDNHPPHPFTGFYLPFPAEDLLHRPIPYTPTLGLVSTIPPSAEPISTSKKPKLNWIYADRETRELKYGPRAEAKKHTVGSWDWTEDEQGLTLDDEECLVAVEEEEGGYGWAVYWDKGDDRLKGVGIASEKRVLRCSLERRLVEEKKIQGLGED
ncbi:hypothetical protein BDU57DRAFT_478265 [Ampelomyces quisqualis]|uniref:Uncharacterized protein n=1 Tax=Ampelomyces quisqualis TaxID=50730 RepID=A0A6A5QFY6_AMPQU|nr:hypothetical protein BDU57DRAFT_478265 [Ampelomyces quisqualis]